MSSSTRTVPCLWILLCSILESFGILTNMAFVLFLKMHAMQFSMWRVWREVSESCLLALLPLWIELFLKIAWWCVSFVLLSKNHRSVVAFSVRPLEDMNEITSHMLEVVQAHMVLSRPQTLVKNLKHKPYILPIFGEVLGAVTRKFVNTT